MIGPVAVLDVLGAQMRGRVRALAPDLDLRFPATKADFTATVRGAPYVVVRSLGLPRGVLDAADTVRLVHQWGTGTDGIPVAAAQTRGIVVARSPGLNAPTVADLIIALMLMALRRLSALDAATRAGDWAPAHLISGARDLCEMRVGLLGFGAIGRAVARRLAGFGSDVIHHRPSGQDAPGWVPMDELLATSGVLSLHLPLSDATRHILDAPAIAAMRPGAVIVNTARGGLIDEVAMTGALRSGHLSAAGLDVFSTEPVAPDNPLLTQPNVVALPHVGGRTDDNLVRLVRHWVGNIAAFDAGRAIDPACLM